MTVYLIRLLSLYESVCWLCMIISLGGFQEFTWCRTSRTLSSSRWKKKMRDRTTANRKRRRKMHRKMHRKSRARIAKRRRSAHRNERVIKKRKSNHFGNSEIRFRLFFSFFETMLISFSAVEFFHLYFVQRSLFLKNVWNESCEINSISELLLLLVCSTVQPWLNKSRAIVISQKYMIGTVLQELT